MAIIYGQKDSPTLDLNFAKNKSLIDTMTGRNLVTFSRTQTGNEATYVGADGLIKYAAADEPRFDHNPETGESLGLLVEESRTNLLAYSQQFLLWNTYNSPVITQNAITAPDGSMTGAKIASVNGGFSVLQGVNDTNGTLTVFAKAAEFRYLVFTTIDWGGAAIFDLQTGTVELNSWHPVFTVGTASITAYPNGWYRCCLPSTVRVYIGATNTYTPSGYGFVFSNGNGTSGIYIWGAQLEVGSFPTSYIPTEESTKTRSADVASITGSNFSSWYNQSEGTMFAQARLDFNTATFSVFPNIYTAGGYPDRIFTLYLNGGINQLTVGGDSFQRNLQTVSSSPQSFKVAQALSNTSLAYSASKDGAAVLTGSLLKSITNTSSMNLGADPGAVKRISHLTYWPKRLPNTTLQRLTR